MPIANCGFPPITIVPGTNPPQVIPAPMMLRQMGPTIPVEIGFNPDLFDPDPTKVQQAAAAAHATPPTQLVNALIDTGATECAIDEELAKQLKLPLIDHVQGSGIGGAETFDVYLGHIRIASLGMLHYGRFMGVKLKAGHQPHQALLGRAVFEAMIIVYDGRDGTVRLAV